MANSSGSPAASPFLAAWAGEEGLLLAALAYAQPQSLSLSIGAGFSAVALLFLIWEQGYTERYPKIVGPYRFVRNPRGLGLWLLGFALALAAGSFAAVLVSLLLLPWLFMIENQKPHRETDGNWTSYSFHVPALIPTLMPFPGSPHAPFSWRRILHRSTLRPASRFLALALAWIWLTLQLQLGLPWWGGLVLAVVWTCIKFFLNARQWRHLSFNKKTNTIPI